MKTWLKAFLIVMAMALVSSTLAKEKDGLVALLNLTVACIFVMIAIVEYET